VAFNLTKAKLAEFTDTRAFEQMCNSLLSREYPGIIPLGGTGDRGRDAIEPPPVRGLFQSDDGGTIFQFSLQKTWEAKLKRELKKVFQYGYKPSQFVFVSNQEVSPGDYDRSKQLSREKYSLSLQLYDMKWLCARLESPDYIQIRRQYLGLDETSLPVFLATDEYMVRRLDQDFAPDLPVFLGRESEIEQIEGFAVSGKKILILSGLPGFGKTKLLVEAARKIEGTSTNEVRFIRPEAESIESHFSELATNSNYVLVLDDAHDFGHYRQLLELIVSPEFKETLHLIVSTHPWAKDNLKAEFERFGHACDELCLNPLTNLQISKLAQHPALGITDSEATDAIVTISEGNPLIAITAATFWKNAGSLAGLTRHQFLSAYFSKALERALKDKREQAYLLLAILAATRGLSLGKPNIQVVLANVVGLSEGDLESLLNQLVGVRLAKRTWHGVRVFPDLFAEHIMFDAFFSDSHKYDFAEKVITPFFINSGDKIFRSLAVAETLGSSSAKTILDRELTDVRRSIKEMNNAQRIGVLNWLKKFAFLRPEDSLLILRSMLELPVCDSTEVESPRWGRLTLTMNDVLRGATEILHDTWLYNESCLRETLSLLYLISGQQDHSRSNQDPWGDSLRVLTEEVIIIQPGKNLRVQEVALEEIEKWLEVNPDEAQQNAIALCLSVFLSVTWSKSELSAVDRHTVTLTSGLLKVDRQLKDIREKAMTFCERLYAMAKPQVRLRIIGYLGNVLSPHIQGTVPDDLKLVLTKDTHVIFSKLEYIAKSEAVPERYAIWKTLKRLHGFGYITTLPDFFDRLYTEEVNMFAHLTAWPGHLRDTEIGYQEAERQHNDYWQEMVKASTSNASGQLLQTINNLIPQADTDHLNAVSININIIARLIREDSPQRLAVSIDEIPKEFEYLKRFSGSFLGEFYLVDHEKASSICDNWIRGSDVTLQREACRALLWISGEEFGGAELEQVRKLADLRDSFIDNMLTWPGSHLKRLERSSPDETITVLKNIADHCDASVLRNLAMLLEEPDGPNDNLVLTSINADDLKELALNFVRLDDLDVGYMYHIESMLRRLFRLNPDAWLEFWEARIERERDEAVKGKYFAAPFHLSTESDYVISSEDRVRVLRTFLEWSTRDEWVYKHNGSRLFKLYSGEQSSTTRDIIEEWLESGEIKKLQSVARVLSEMGYSQYFLETARKLVDKTDDELVQAYLRNTVGSTGVVSGSLKPIWQRRRVDFEKWLEDPSLSITASLFAKQQIEYLRESEELHNEEDREED